MIVGLEGGHISLQVNLEIKSVPTLILATIITSYYCMRIIVMNLCSNTAFNPHEKNFVEQSSPSKNWPLRLQTKLNLHSHDLLVQTHSSDIFTREDEKC